MPGPATLLLQRAQNGDVEARDTLYGMLYSDLRQRAVAQLRGERENHTLTPTALVHEAYLALAGQEENWNDHRHLLAVAATAMRHLLVDYARRRGAIKRGPEAVHVPLDTVAEHLDFGVAGASAGDPGAALLDFDRALTGLGEHDARLVEVVECRVFGGLTVPETATALNVSSATVDRTWAKARAYLRTALADEGGR